MKNPPIIGCRFIPKKYCVNILGTIWTRDKSWIDKYVINHERIHTAQQKELAFVGFYLAYLLEWVIKLVIYKSSRKAYMNLSFEREAYRHGQNLKYLKSRKLYSWMRYVFSSRDSNG